MAATLRAARRPHIGRSPDPAAAGHPRFPAVLAIEIDALPDQSVESVRRLRRAWSARLRSAPADQVIALAEALLPRHRWVAYELVHHHSGALAALDLRLVERLGRGIDDCAAVDAFGRSISAAGDAARTLAVCERLAADPDDVVAEALSWALEELGVHDPQAVREFRERHVTQPPDRPAP